MTVLPPVASRDASSPIGRVRGGHPHPGWLRWQRLVAVERDGRFLGRASSASAPAASAAPANSTPASIRTVVVPGGGRIAAGGDRVPR